MKIEGYLFVPYRGQYRFSFEAFQQGGHVRIDEVKESNRAFDYFWDVGMRGRPTLYELVETPHMRKEFERAVINLFKDKLIAILENKSTYLKQAISEGYVEYRVAE